MYGLVRFSTYDPAALEKGSAQLAEFQALHAALPGYAGTIVIEISPARWVTVNLWDSERDAAAALPTMVPVVQRLLEPMMAGPSELIGSGPVILTDLKKG